MKVQGTPVVELLTAMLSRGEPVQIQINAAKCLTYLYRCGVQELDKNVVYKKVSYPMKSAKFSFHHKKIQPCFLTRKIEKLQLSSYSSFGFGRATIRKKTHLRHI